MEIPHFPVQVFSRQLQNTCRFFQLTDKKIKIEFLDFLEDTIFLTWWGQKNITLVLFLRILNLFYWKYFESLIYFVRLTFSVGVIFCDAQTFKMRRERTWCWWTRGEISLFPTLAFFGHAKVDNLFFLFSWMRAARKRRSHFAPGVATRSSKFLSVTRASGKASARMLPHNDATRCSPFGIPVIKFRTPWQNWYAPLVTQPPLWLIHEHTAESQIHFSSQNSSFSFNCFRPQRQSNWSIWFAAE